MPPSSNRVWLLPLVLAGLTACPAEEEGDDGPSGLLARTRTWFGALRQSIADRNAAIDSLGGDSDAPSPFGDGGPTPEQIAAAVRCESEERCNIDRAFVDDLLISPTVALRQVTVLPDLEGFHTRGFRLYSVEDKVPEALGLRGGDVLLSVNGDALESMEAAITAFQNVGWVRPIVLEYERDGQMRTLTITIA